MNEEDAVRKRWLEYFERLLNIEEIREAKIEIIAVGREQGARTTCVRRVE